MSRPIDADELSRRMYDEAFEKDSEDQRWDSGCWIRYRLFERVLKEQPTIEPERMKFVQEAVNTLMNTSKTNSIKDKCFRNAARFVQNAIDGEPQDFELIPDEPERKVGKWENGCICSVCGERCDYHLSGDIWIEELANFCPNCGAKMEGWI